MDIERDTKHYVARLELWWSGVKRSYDKRRAAQAERASKQRTAREEYERKLAAGEIAMAKGWYQHPKDPPDVQRWWDGDRWTDHSRPVPGVKPSGQRNQSSGLVLAGWLTFVLGLAFWPAFIAPFVIGIILAARGVAGHGAAMIVLSLLGPLISLVVIAAWLSGS